MKFEVGGRYLVRGRYDIYTMHEVTVMEVTDKNVKFKWAASGHCSWNPIEDYTIIEKLPYKTTWLTNIIHTIDGNPCQIVTKDCSNPRVELILSLGVVSNMTIDTYDIAAAIDNRIKELEEQENDIRYGSLGKNMYKDKNARTAAADSINVKISKLQELSGLFS